MENIHQRIKRLRLSKGMKLEDLAKRVGVSWQTVQQWEREDGTAPKRGRQQAVADVFGISVAELVTGADQAGSASPSVAVAYDSLQQDSVPLEAQEIASAYAGAPDEVKSAVQLILRMATGVKPSLRAVEQNRDASERGCELDDAGTSHPFFPNTTMLTDDIRKPAVPRRRGTD